MESRNFLQVVLKFCKTALFLQVKSVKLQYCTMFVYIVSVRNYNNNGVQPFSVWLKVEQIYSFSWSWDTLYLLYTGLEVICYKLFYIFYGTYILYHVGTAFFCYLGISLLLPWWNRPFPAKLDRTFCHVGTFLLCQVGMDHICPFGNRSFFMPSSELSLTAKLKHCLSAKVGSDLTFPQLANNVCFLHKLGRWTVTNKVTMDLFC